MSDASGLPDDIEVGDAHALRTFAVEDGRLASIAQRRGHWEDGVCEAICTEPPRIPTMRCLGRVPVWLYAFWTVKNCSTSIPTSPAASSRSFGWTA